MAIVVQKYGGSSVADIDKLRAVADQVVATKRGGHDVVVVVSAMGKTTDNLLALAREASAGLSEPPRRELDMLLSTGERVSMALLSIAIQARGEDAVSFTGSQSGIITNDRHFDARIIEVRPHRIDDELARGRIVIVAGYQGMSYRREITTLGRGGSDTTALALAAALGAERAEIYSDVDGVYSADPRVVPEARHMPALDYATMQEMAECGAKVLNAQAVEWARKSRIAIHARKTGQLVSGDPVRETVVGPQAPADAARRAVVVQNKLALLQAPRSALPRLLDLAARSGVPLGDFSSAGRGVELWVPLLNVPDWPVVRRTLTAEIPELEVSEELGLVSLVGVEIGTQPEIVARALSSVVGEPRWVVSSALRLSVVLRTTELEPTARSWHAGLVTQLANSAPEPQPSPRPESGIAVSPVS
jgi:aspartate kinase